MSIRKGYPRKPYSFERVLKDLADDIGYDNIETVIEKKRKAIENISNPNFKGFKYKGVPHVLSIAVIIFFFLFLIKKENFDSQNLHWLILFIRKSLKAISFKLPFRFS